MNLGYWTIPFWLVVIAGFSYVLGAALFNRDHSRYEGWVDFLDNVAAGAAVLAFFTGIFCGIFTYDQFRCEQVGDSMGVDSRYSIATKCLVKVSDRWIPLDSYRGTEDQ